MLRTIFSKTHVQTPAEQRRQRAALLLILSVLVFLPALSVQAAAALPTPTSSPTALRLHTPTPAPRLLLPLVTSNPPRPQATPTSPQPAPSPTPAPGLVSIRVDAAQRFQRIDGFGATHLSLVYEGGMGDVLSPPLRLKAIDAVYRQVKINLGNLESALLESPGSYDQRSNDNDDPNAINWGGFQTTGAQIMRSAIIELAARFGFTGYFPGQKINVRWASPWLGDLRASDYNRYLSEAAEQVAAGVRFWQTQENSAPRLLMPFNEPLSGNGELASGSTQEVVDLVKAIAERLRREGYSDVRLVAPNEETVQKTLETAGALVADPAAKAALGVIGYHTYPYGSVYASIPRILATSGRGAPDAGAVAERQSLAALAEAAGLPVWMTEVSHGEVDPISFDALRGRAIHIHDELRYAGASAYFGMNNIWDTQSQREHFGNDNLFDPANEGNIVLVDTDAGQVYITGIGYAIGHYARWLPPGAVRVAASSGDPLVNVTAIYGGSAAQGATLELVLINNANTPRSLQIDVTGMTLGSTLGGEQSTSAAAWQTLKGATKVAPGQLRLLLPAASVTTLAVAP